MTGTRPKFEGLFPPDSPMPPGADTEARAQEDRLRAVGAAPRGRRYISAVNTTQVGLWYMAAGFAFCLFAGVLALPMQVQFAVPGNELSSAETCNEVHTLRGPIVTILFAVPIFEAFATFLMPQLLGARELPFPRAGACGFRCYRIGGVFVAGSIYFDAAPDGGWFMYPPLIFDPDRSVDPLLGQLLFRILGHPEVCIIFLPSVAPTAMIVPTFARRPILGYFCI